MVNIVEKYIQNKDQLIILISGFSGSGKTLLAKNIERDFKLNFLNLNDFYKKDYINIVDLGNNIKVNDASNKIKASTTHTAKSTTEVKPLYESEEAKRMKQLAGMSNRLES